jgi:hypothetical protein
LTEDFYLLTEYLEGKQNQKLHQWCSDFGKFAINPSEKAIVDGITDEKQKTEKIIELVQPVIEPVWSFFVALCHALQEGENELTARDAYWLGLIDEVLGEPDMSARRMIGEYEPDPPVSKPDQPQPASGAVRVQPRNPQLNESSTGSAVDSSHSDNHVLSEQSIPFFRTETNQRVIGSCQVRFFEPSNRRYRPLRRVRSNVKLAECLRQSCVAYQRRARSRAATVQPSIASRSCSSRLRKTQIVSLTPYNTTFSEQPYIR